MTREDRGASSFDELAVGLSSGTLSRGKALRLMGAALVGGTLASLGGVAAADEECKPLNKKCRKNHQCCSGTCTEGKCACPSDRVLLSNGTCVKPCNAPTDCPDCSGPNAGCFFATPEAIYCGSGPVVGSSCGSLGDCPPGQFCQDPGEVDARCIVAC
jgi:hypothetical protein